MERKDIEKRPSIAPYLCVDDVGQAIAYYKKAFGAEEVMHAIEGTGNVDCAEILIHNTRLFLSGEFPDTGFRSPTALGGTPVQLRLYVDDCDRVFGRAVTAGATVLTALEDKSYGIRGGTLRDPFGHVWHIATRTEHPALTEVRRRAAAALRRKEPAHPVYESGID